MLRYQDFLSKVVDRSKAISEHYYDGAAKPLLDGALAGLEACRDKSPPQLAALLERVATAHRLAFNRTAINRYLRITSFMHEVEWVCCVVSAALINQGMTGIVKPSTRAIEMVNLIVSETEEN